MPVRADTVHTLGLLPSLGKQLLTRPCVYEVPSGNDALVPSLVPLFMISNGHVPIGVVTCPDPMLYL